MDMRDIYFVFVNYNDHVTTIHCIESINRMSKNGTDVHIILIDNDSDRDDFIALSQKAKQFINVSLYKSEKNLGYFGGLNYGISKINSTNDVFVVAGNNDLLFPENFIDCIQKKMELAETYPVISPNIITLDGVHQNPHVINKISGFRYMLYELYFLNYYFACMIKTIAKITGKFSSRKDQQQHEIAQTIFSGYGACYILTPLFFRNYDKLWAPTFLMGEELFLSLQLGEKGFKIFYEPSIVVKHCLHITMGKMPGKNKWKLERESRKLYQMYEKAINQA